MSSEPSEVQQQTGNHRLNESTLLVMDAWLTLAPPLIDHRPPYLREIPTIRAVNRAVERYDEDTVILAIHHYATVLGGDEYWWDHRWTLIDFLKRGLDKFVPEAKPLDNFRHRATANGRAPTLLERLKAEQADP